MSPKCINQAIYNAAFNQQSFHFRLFFVSAEIRFGQPEFFISEAAYSVYIFNNIKIDMGITCVKDFKGSFGEIVKAGDVGFVRRYMVCPGDKGDFKIHWIQVEWRNARCVRIPSHYIKLTGETETRAGRNQCNKPVRPGQALQ